MYVVMRELDSNNKIFYTVVSWNDFDGMQGIIRRCGFGFNDIDDAIKKAKKLAKKYKVSFVCPIY